MCDLSAYLSFCLPACLSAYLCVRLPVCLSDLPRVRLYTREEFLNVKLPVTRSSLGDPVVVLGLELIWPRVRLLHERRVLKCEVTCNTIILR